MFTVIYTEKAKKELSKIDKTQAKIIVNWINKNINGISNPYSKGKSITGKLADWRYRVGNYRILCNINDKEIIIEVINIAHRKHIYKK